MTKTLGTATTAAPGTKTRRPRVTDFLLKHRGGRIKAVLLTDDKQEIKLGVDALHSLISNIMELSEELEAVDAQQEAEDPATVRH